MCEWKQAAPGDAPALVSPTGTITSGLGSAAVGSGGGTAPSGPIFLVYGRSGWIGGLLGKILKVGERAGDCGRECPRVCGFSVPVCPACSFRARLVF